MPVKRRVAKVKENRITPEAVAAYRAGDYHALHRALGLKPWEASPLPSSVTLLGVEDGPAPSGNTAWAASWAKAQELRRELERAAKG
jgi:hypothetical protein